MLEPFQRFFKKIVRGSVPLFIATVVALVWSLLSYTSYHHVWHTELTIALGDFRISKSLVHWIDDALMTLFFFTVGLEIKREMLVGELASVKKALLPVSAAIGGMLFPAAIYAALNHNTPAASGWGIPMATDIAFSLAVLAVLRTRIPLGLKVFLSAFAIADDLGAVLVIALFYTQSIAWNYLLLAGFFLLGLAIANFFWIRSTLVYAVLGICIWFAILGSGIHATVAGVIVAMFIPARGKYDTDTFITEVNKRMSDFHCEPGSCGNSILLNPEHLNAAQGIEFASHAVQTPVQRLEHGLYSWIAYLILPLFALANAGFTLEGMNISHAIGHSVTLGIILGLVVGKPLGIILFTYLAYKILKTPLPSGVTWSHIIGASILGGIGFTMSLFISSLSFTSHEFIGYSKLGILVGSVISGVLGLIVLRLRTTPQTETL
ncbi:MAG: Na+/H+ antiporter NhaA [Deltaproteobacteria bacterium]|nr:Na+/H+ antiporter NhaA [Deltaproteobacteria bacterium]